MADWWAGLGDPVLDRLVALVLGQNRDLKAAEADVRRARALARAEGWTLLSWQGTPVGGSDLVDDTAEDPTGETLEEAHDALADVRATAAILRKVGSDLILD